MRQIKQFITEDSGLLSTQLSKLEDNVVQQFAADELAANPTPMFFGGGAIITVGESAIIDTSGGALTVSISPAQDGRPGFINLISTTNNLTIKPLTGKIQGAASVTKGVGLSLVYFDGSNFWLPA
jgi:hypothetical protein